MVVHSAFNRGPRVQFDSGKVSRTKQAFKRDVDINNIMRKYVKTGLIDHFSKHSGEYGFASGVVFHEAMNIVTKAESMFADLPAAVRLRFENDPADFLEFVQNPANAEEMIELGLREPRGGEVAVEVPRAPVAESAPESGSDVVPGLDRDTELPVG